MTRIEGSNGLLRFVESQGNVLNRDGLYALLLSEELTLLYVARVVQRTAGLGGEALNMVQTACSIGASGVLLVRRSASPDPAQFRRDSEFFKEMRALAQETPVAMIDLVTIADNEITHLAPVRSSERVRPRFSDVSAISRQVESSS